MRSRISVEHEHPTHRVDESRLRRLVRKACAGEGFAVGEVNLILTDHAGLLELNRAYLSHDYHTDVLSFDLRDDPDERRVVGEVYVDLDTAAERHEEFGASFEEEVARYVVHGVLHLMGYDDSTPEAREAMASLEDRYLAAAR